MIIRRAVFDAIGLLGEGLYTYYDDVDYCPNAKRAGWPTWYVPASRVVHLVGASTGVTAGSIKRRPTYWFEARRRYFVKNYGPVYAAMANLAFISGLAIWRLRRWVQRKPDNDPPHMLGDALSQSVFVQGCRVPLVQNPALAPAHY